MEAELTACTTIVEPPSILGAPVGVRLELDDMEGMDGISGICGITGVGDTAPNW
jgi:hypothetical protein